MAVKSDSLFWAARNFRVCSSLGKRLVVTPSSAPILVIVARCGTLRDSTPLPKYSTTQPTLPFVVNILRSFRMTSLAATQSFNLPVNFTPATFGQVMKKGPPAMATATSIPPAPMAIIPMPLLVGVCESLPKSVWAGFAKRSRCTW